MLSLITHEPNFFIIRESLNENIWKKCESCGKNGHFKDECPKLLNPNAPVKDSSDLINEIEFSLIKVHVVREYLELEFRHTKLNFSFDEEMKFERFIDDFVFLCFFVGNDFIPHLPSLKIREGAIDALMYIYKKVVPELDGFLTEGNGTINLARTEILLKKLALVEDAIFQKQLHAKHRELERNAQRAVQSGRIDRSQYQDHIVSEYFKLNKKVKECELTNTEEIKLFDDILDDIDQIIERDEEEYEKEKERKELLNKKASDNFQRVLKEVLKKDQNKKMETYKDPVRLGEVGWKDRYYLEKFKVQPDDPEFKKLIRQSYIEGICWVYAYYYNGCASWEWYYPFHYAPFASDLCEIKDLEVKFKKGVPFEPIHQLLSVLPPYSSKALPQCLRQLMHDPFSELSDFYPDGIKLDINGQPYAWMGVNLIPFIDEHRIRKAVESRKHLFSDEENTRNRFGDTLVFYNQKNHFISKHAVGDNFKTPGYYTYISTPHFRVFSGKIKALNDLSHNINNVQPGKSFKSSIKGLKISEVRGCEIVSMNFENPPSQPHTSQLRKGVLIPPKVVLEDNLDYYCKRNFKGSDAIDLVRRVLGYDLDEAENRMRAELFDHTSNNNRAIEYDPYEMDMLRKKRYKQFHNDDGREGHNTDTRRSHDSYDSRGHYREGHNTDTRRSHDSYDSRREKSSSNYDRHYHHRYEDKRHYNQRNYSDNTYSNSNRRPNNREYATRQVPQHQSADYYNNNNAFNKFSDPSLRANSNMLANTGNMMPQNNSNANQGNVQKEINQGLNDLLKNYQTYVGKNNK
jgi:5'-3' exonuclease